MTSHPTPLLVRHLRTAVQHGDVDAASRAAAELAPRLLAGDPKRSFIEHEGFMLSLLHHETLARPLTSPAITTAGGAQPTSPAASAPAASPIGTMMALRGILAALTPTGKCGILAANPLPVQRSLDVTAVWVAEATAAARRLRLNLVTLGLDAAPPVPSAGSPSDPRSVVEAATLLAQGIEASASRDAQPPGGASPSGLQLLLALVLIRLDEVELRPGVPADVAAAVDGSRRRLLSAALRFEVARRCVGVARAAIATARLFAALAKVEAKAACGDTMTLWQHQAADSSAAAATAAPAPAPAPIAVPGKRGAAAQPPLGFALGFSGLPPPPPGAPPATWASFDARLKAVAARRTHAARRSSHLRDRVSDIAATRDFGEAAGAARDLDLFLPLVRDAVVSAMPSPVAAEPEPAADGDGQLWGQLFRARRRSRSPASAAACAFSGRVLLPVMPEKHTDILTVIEVAAVEASRA